MIDISEDLQKKLLQLDLDDDGLAEAFLMLFEGRYRYSNEVGWMVYTGKYWSRKAGEASAECDIKIMLRVMRGVLSNEVKRLLVDEKDTKKAIAKVNACKGKASTIRNVKAILASHPRVFCDLTNFDSDPDTINASNGVVNLKTGKLTPHDPSQLFTYCLDVKRIENCPPPKEFLAFLKSTELPTDIIKYIKLASGYTLTGHTSEEVIFFLHGKSRSGKSTILDVFVTIMGDLASGANMQSFTGKRYGDTNNFDLAPFRNKRLIVATETGISNSLNAATIKALTGGDPVYASFKGRDHFTYVPIFKMWFASNNPPNSNADDDAYWTRQRIIDFLKSFIGKEDKTLKRRLKKKDSLNAIFNWMIDGAIEWYTLAGEGLPLPEVIKTSTNAHRKAADSVSLFIESHCSLSPDSFAVGATLYNSYKQWCEDEGYKPYGRRRFTSTLLNVDVTSTTKRLNGGKVTRVYVGIEEL